MTINPAKKAQIASVLIKKVTGPAKYLAFANIFSKKLAELLSEQTRINEHAITLEESKQPSYRPIYSLTHVELETLKTYIKINLANGFIQPSKSPADAPILFVCKPDGSLRLCVDYWGLNNLTIKNRYPLPLINESLNWLKQAKQFTQLDFTSFYHQMKIKEGDKYKTTFKTR